MWLAAITLHQQKNEPNAIRYMRAECIWEMINDPGTKVFPAQILGSAVISSTSCTTCTTTAPVKQRMRPMSK